MKEKPTSQELYDIALSKSNRTIDDIFDRIIERAEQGFFSIDFHYLTKEYCAELIERGFLLYYNSGSTRVTWYK